eukprot:6184559-Pleurochrysis_carterae.AAC.7
MNDAELRKGLVSHDETEESDVSRAAAEAFMTIKIEPPPADVPAATLNADDDDDDFDDLE